MLRKHLGKLAKESATENRPKTPETKITETEVVSWVDCLVKLKKNKVETTTEAVNEAFKISINISKLSRHLCFRKLLLLNLLTNKFKTQKTDPSTRPGHDISCMKRKPWQSQRVSMRTNSKHWPTLLYPMNGLNKKKHADYNIFNR